MINDKFKHFFKTYFYFSAKERNGIFTLLLLILVIAVLPNMYNMLYPSNLENIEIAVQNNASKHEKVSWSNIEKTNSNSFEDRFHIDPNTADDKTWLKLGLKKYQINILRNYQKAGGYFHKPEDFKKLRSLTSEQYQAIIPHLKTAPRTDNNSHPDFDSLQVKRKHLQYPIDLNNADSESIVALYGIGPKLASKIVNYRNSLGGFFSLNQLNDIYMFNEDLLYDLKGKIRVDTGSVKKMNLNTVSLETLQNHPYFKFKLSKIIVNYRQQHGAYQQVKDLYKIVVMNDSIYNKIAPYLYVE